MRSELTAHPHPHQIVQYDSVRRRLWVLGQRCHHGATGSVVAAVAFMGLVSAPATHTRPRPLVALAATGGALMAHDWKDHTIWFERGHQNQP
jgi:hypothetical protein